MITRPLTPFALACLLALTVWVRHGRAASATSITGFYYTGENATGGLLSQGSGTLSSNSGTQDPYWAVTYATTNGGATANTANMGTAYVIN
jgi:hypothetical protein